MINKPKDLKKSYESFCDKYTTASRNQLNNLGLSSIHKSVHYICNKCLKFPYIKFCKDSKHIRLTCSCFNNKKILIKDYFKNNILSIENIYKSYNDKIIENSLICKEHKKRFKGFTKIFFDNYCESCIKNKNDDSDIIIRFDDIKIEDKKIEQLLKVINNDNNIKTLEESNTINTIKIINIKDSYCRELSKKDEFYFNNLIIN